MVAEVYGGAPLSYWTRDAEALLVALARVATVVPATTRTRAQFARIQLPPPTAARRGHDQRRPPPRRRRRLPRLVAHGRRHLAASTGAPLGDVVDHLARRPPARRWLRSQRVAEDLFAYLVVDRAEMPASFLTDLAAWCDGVGWTVSLQGRKVYCVPARADEVGGGRRGGGAVRADDRPRRRGLAARRRAARGRGRRGPARARRAARHRVGRAAPRR